jgi:hypothetical protein
VTGGPETIPDELRRIAIQDPEHLKHWLRETGRQWIVLHAGDLIDALPWPEGVDAFMMIVEAYRQHRITIPTDYGPCPKARVHRAGVVCDLCLNRGEIVIRSKTDVLEVEEMKEAVVWLLNQIRETDRTWNPFTIR